MAMRRFDTVRVENSICVKAMFNLSPTDQKCKSIFIVVIEDTLAYTYTRYEYTSSSCRVAPPRIRMTREIFLLPVPVTHAMCLLPYYTASILVEVPR